MTSKEALREIITATLKYLPDSVIEKNSKLSNIVLQDLERLEALEKENKKWREIVGCDLCEALGREILLEENEKLKKQVEDLENNKRGSK